MINNNVKKNKDSNIIVIKNLFVQVDDQSIINDFSLSLELGTIHAIMGPNGSGKSTLAYTLMGHPRYTITSGTILFKEKPIEELSPDDRARLGIFLGMQHPYEIEGIPYKEFLRASYNALYDGTGRQLTLKEFNNHLEEKMELLNIDHDFITRSINVGFSGGEKKRAEILQLAILEPQFVILDEIDSGLDIDALKLVCEAIMTVKKMYPSMTFLLITHYQRLLTYIKPDFVHVMSNGRIIQSGNDQLALELEKHGYAALKT